MKVKELLKTVNVAWSPPAQYPILLAAGTAAQQLDASFSTSASLDLYALGLQEPGREMELKASVSSDHRFHKIIWGAHNSNAAGIIVGGCDYGTIQIYSAAKLIANESSLISSPDKHTGPVRAMDFNQFQTNLLATGATESEIFIWDINNTNTPMTPGSRSQPLEDVQYIAWNKQVQHILASTFSQRCVIWDLRKNEPIIKLTDANSRVRWKVVQWHPDIATQLCIASEDDQSPVIELWDLRFATSPLKTLQNHQRGVLSIAWNPHDSDLLLSCAKDNRILCWNPNSDAPNGEVICELAQTSQWNFDVSWCPRHPGLIVGTSFDGHAVIYSLLGGQQLEPAETSSKIVDSFPGMDPFTQPPPVAYSEATVILKKAPKWLKRPSGVSFGFGGKLTTFQDCPVDPNLPTNSKGQVIISQVITDPDLIQRSNELENALRDGQFGDFCKGKADCATDEHDKKVWNCVGAYFEENVTKGILKLLGYDLDAMSIKLKQLVPPEEVDAITEGVSKLDNRLNGNAFDGSAAFDAIAQQELDRKSPLVKPMENFKINTSDDEDGLISQAILLGNIEAAVSLCFKNKRYAEAVILSMAGGPELLAKTQYRYFSEHSGALNSLINSLVSEDWNDIVKNCDLNCWKEALVGVFTHTSPEERSTLCDLLGDRLAAYENSALQREAQICYICSGNLNKIIQSTKGNIQEVVELVVIMQKALDAQGFREVQIEGNIVALLSQYAEMLATEGSLETALNYLGNSQGERIVTLRDRLCKALGYVQPNAQQFTPRASVGHQSYYDQTRKQSIPQQNAYNQARPTAATNEWNTMPLKQSYGAAAAFNQFNAPQPQFGLPPPIQTLQPSYQDPYQPPAYSYSQAPAPQALPPPPPPPQASSASLSGSRPPSVGPQSRSKYILDPSVKSSSSYGASNAGFPQQSQMYNSQQVSPVPGFPVQNSYQPQPSMPVSSYPNQAQSQMFNPTVPEPPKPVQPNVLSPMPSSMHSQMYNPITSQPQQQAQSAYSNDIPAYQPPTQQSGWNDPPIGKSSRPQPKTDFQAQNPILHPLGAGAQADLAPNLMPQENLYPNSQMGYSQQQYGQTIPNSAVPFSNPVNHMQPMQPMQPAQPAQTIRAPEPEKPKLPIPEEHVHLKTVLDELKSQCFESAKNPQIKRKIEDVSRKLEVLYDCLRENKLTQNTLQGLHQMSQMIQSGDYRGGLNLHTQLVSGSDFSQIASFMPGIKVLLQSALQLGVYIR